jgi:hypothetical protein
MALLKAYFDASSGGDGSGTFAVGGFVGRESDWIAAEERWNEGKNTFSIDEFHLADVMFNLGREMGSLCVLHFSKIMGMSNLHGIGASCDVAHWKSHDTGYKHPYHFCFSMALGVLCEEVALEFGSDPVALVVDDDFKPPDLAHDIFAAHKRQNGNIFASLRVGNRRTDPQIQYADLAVGALRKEWLDGLLNNKTVKEFYGALGPKARFAHFSAETEKIASEAQAEFRNGGA